MAGAGMTRVGGSVGARSGAEVAVAAGSRTGVGVRVASLVGAAEDGVSVRVSDCAGGDDVELASGIVVGAGVSCSSLCSNPTMPRQALTTRLANRTTASRMRFSIIGSFSRSCSPRRHVVTRPTAQEAFPAHRNGHPVNCTGLCPGSELSVACALSRRLGIPPVGHCLVCGKSYRAVSISCATVSCSGISRFCGHLSRHSPHSVHASPCLPPRQCSPRKLA